jgi:hypothetical protein
MTPSNIHDHTRWRMQPLCTPHCARLFQHNVSHDLGVVCTPPDLLNEPSTSPRYLRLRGEFQGRKDDPDQGRIGACLKAIRHVLVEFEHYPGKIPTLAKAYPTERAGIGLRRAAQMAHQE